MKREFDIVVWGATGFTGRLVAEYLLEKYGLDGGLKWAMGGRSESKLESVSNLLGNRNIPLIVADSNDKPSLDEMVKRTKVICTTVGPYAKYGSELVASCVEHKTDYCDLTGEVQWMRRMIDQHQEAAVQNGVRIVHTCGFDSIPSDLGVLFLQNEIKKRTGEYAEKVKFRVKAMKGTMSGGTYASMTNVMEEAQADKSVIKTLMNPYGLNPKGEMTGPDKPDLSKVVFDQDFKSWICPFVMAVINTKVVRRSHALAGYPYGKDFRYDEAVLTGRGAIGKLKGIGTLFGLAAITAGKPGGLYKKILGTILPKPGDGPDIEQRENGFYNLILLGKTKSGTTMRVRVKGDRDPGYGSTSKMLGESAVCLAKDTAVTPKVSGLLTPSVAMGEALLQRLIENAGLTFEIEE